MKYVDEYRERDSVKKLSQSLLKATTKPWTIMEVCGGQTHALLRFGIESLLPKQIRLIHGPGCPVCVTPIQWIDKALEIASNPKVIFCSFGDMLRVPGSLENLFAIKARGGDVRIVYSPLDAVALARRHPKREVVFFAVGFETTAPATAQAAWLAQHENLSNFSLLVCHVLVPPAMEALLADPQNGIDAFLAAGHVCTVMGYEAYQALSHQYRVPIVVTGFEPLDLLEGIYRAVVLLESGKFGVENQYSRSVTLSGNSQAQELMKEVFETTSRHWRGMGNLPLSGLSLRKEYQSIDAQKKFGNVEEANEIPSQCLSGLVLRGKMKPDECPEFGKNCRPENPLGAPMVSSEGACAAYFRYQRNRQPEYENKTLLGNQNDLLKHKEANGEIT